MKFLVDHFCELPRPIRPLLWRVWHHVIQHLDPAYSKVFLNYGYASPNGEFDGLALAEQDEPDRYGIQLYHHVTYGGNLYGKSVLEVGCGRGGGAAFLARYGGPKEYVGLDISPNLVAYCNRFHQVPGLSFVAGTAERLPFENARFDAVVNVESARCYGDPGAFFRETHRVLRPGGCFYFADMIKNADLDRVRRMLLQAGFIMLRQSDIRKNVVLALHRDAAVRKKTIDERVPGWLRKAFYEFAGVEGSRRFREFERAAMHYHSFVLQKPVT